MTKTTVLFNTLWKSLYDGWCVASRAYARCMEKTGVDVRLYDWRDQELRIDPEVYNEAARFARYPRQWDLHVFSATLGSAEGMRESLVNTTQNPGSNAFFTMFERRYVEPELAEILNMFSAVWVPCSMNERVLREAGVERVARIPMPYFDDDPHLALPSPTDSRRFYSITRFEPRKDPANVIRAFMHAFRPGEAELTIKTSPIAHSGGDYYTHPVEVVIEELRRHHNGWTVDNWHESIRFNLKKLSAADMVQIHADNDVYVSASRGEGIDLPAFAAKLAGRRVVTTESGGPEDFLDRDVDVIVPSTGVIDASPAFKWGPGATLTDYSLDALSHAMRVAFELSPPRHRALREEFRADSVASKLGAWIEQYRVPRQSEEERVA